jgi:hypothetical protein
MTKGHLFAAYNIISVRSKWAEAISKDIDKKVKFTARDALVLERAAFHASRFGTFKAGYARIGKELDYSEKTIGRAFANLKELRLVTKIKNGGGGLDEFDEERLTSSEWQILLKPLPSLPGAFGGHFARVLASLQQEAKEKRLNLVAKMESDEVKEQIANMDWTTKTDDGIEEL